MNYEHVNNQIDLASKTMKIILQFGISAGVLVVLSYCGRVGYYPTGLTVGDGLLFVAVALSFGFTYSLVVMMLYCTAITLTPLWRVLSKIIITLERARRKLTNQSNEIIVNEFRPLTGDHISMVILGLVGLLIIARTAFIDLELFYGLVGSVVLIAFMALMYENFDSVDNSSGSTKNRKLIKFIFLLGLYFTPLIIGKFQGGVLDQTMRLIGIRNDSSTVQFVADYAHFVESNVEKREDGLYPSKVLFSGFGATSVIEIDGVRFVVPNDKYNMVIKKVLTKTSS